MRKRSSPSCTLFSDSTRPAAFLICHARTRAGYWRIAIPTQAQPPLIHAHARARRYILSITLDEVFPWHEDTMKYDAVYSHTLVFIELRISLRMSLCMSLCMSLYMSL